MNKHEPDETNLVPGALVDCPTCGLPAEITDRFTLGVAPEPVEHLRVVCARRHWYSLPVDTFRVSAPLAGPARARGCDTGLASGRLSNVDGPTRK